MKAKFFVMASVIALPGAVAAIAMQGCSSDNTDGTTTNGTDASDAPPIKPPAKDTSPPDEPDTGPETCPGTTPIAETDLPLKWAPPPAIQAMACSQADIDKLKAKFAASTGSVKFADIKTELGPTCTACVFSPLKNDAGTDATEWSIFVETGTGAVDNRTGACFARIKDVACGKARYNFESCLRTGCPATECGSDSNVKDCKTKIQSGACKALTDVYVAACPDEQAMIDACNIYASIAVSCSGGLDAGIDSSAP